jgi:thiosulfate dehydrogenase [quinone] large subunit
MSSTSHTMRDVRSNVNVIEDPPLARFLFGDVRLSWVWLVIRLYVGYEWVTAGIEKLGNPVWFGSKAGVALTGFVNGALAKTTGSHPDVQTFYAWFLQHIVLPNAATWSYMVSIGETLVGIALILGLFTGIAAFFGGFMNANYLLAGTISTNPLLFIFATWLVLAWKTAGWVGLDHWVLTMVGTPGKPGKIFKKSEPQLQP